MIRLLWLTEMISDESRKDIMMHWEIRSLFPGRVSLHKIELLDYLKFYVIAAVTEKNPNKIEALHSFLEDYACLPEIDLVALLHLLALAKIKYITEYYVQ